MIHQKKILKLNTKFYTFIFIIYPLCPLIYKTIHNDALCHWNTQNGSVEKDGNLTVFLLFNWLKQHIDENDFQNIFLLQLRNLRHPKLLILPQVRVKKPDVCAWKWVCDDVKLYKSIYMYMEISNCLDLIWFFFLSPHKTILYPLALYDNVTAFHQTLTSLI